MKAPATNTKSLDSSIEALGIYRQFGQTTVIANLDLLVKSGEIHALLGPNGAGKTTVLRMLAGLTFPSAGSVAVLGGDPTKREIRQRIGWIPSGDRSFYLRLSGRENLIFFARLYGVSLRDSRLRSEELLELVGLEHASDMPVRLYSHGMQKRLGIARGILMEPDVLIVDEATHDLDPAGAEMVRGLVSGFAEKGAAIVWATQRLDEIRSFAHGVTVLGRGDTRFSGSVEGLITRAMSRTYEVQLAKGVVWDATPLKVALEGLAEIGEHPFRSDIFLMHTRSEVALSDIFDAIEDAGARVHSCSEARSDVEEAFLHLTSGSGDD